MKKILITLTALTMLSCSQDNEVCIESSCYEIVSKTVVSNDSITGITFFEVTLLNDCTQREVSKTISIIDPNRMFQVYNEYIVGDTKCEVLNI